MSPTHLVTRALGVRMRSRWQPPRLRRQKMSEQLQIPGLEGDSYRESIEIKLESEALKSFGKNLIADNHDIMLKDGVRGPTRHEGSWIVVYRPHLEEYVEKVDLHISNLERQARPNSFS